jgi:allantoinase
VHRKKWSDLDNLYL